MFGPREQKLGVKLVKPKKGKEKNFMNEVDQAVEPVSEFQDEVEGDVVEESPVVKGGSPLGDATAALRGMKKLALDHFVRVGKQDKVWPHIPTGNIKIDYLIGELDYCPGIPRGGITNIYGPEHSGKTSFSLHVCAAAIAAGGCVCYIDFENILDTRYARKLGIPVDDESKFILCQPETLEQGVITMLYMAHNGVDLVVLDSIGAALPKETLDISVEDVQEGKTGRIGTRARKWSEYLPRIQQKLKEGNTAMIAVSQLRSGINVGYGNEDTVQGGRGWKFYSMLRLELKPTNKIYNDGVMNVMEGKKEKKYFGTKIQISVRKSKISPTQGRSTMVDCIPNYGFDPIRSLVDLAKNLKVIKMSGSWFSYKRDDGSDIKTGGFDKFYAMISDNREVLSEMYRRCLATIRATVVPDKGLDNGGNFVEEEFEDEEYAELDKRGKMKKSNEDKAIDVLTQPKIDAEPEDD